MKKNTIAAVLGLALAALASPFSAFADVTGGDIYSVDLDTYNNGTTEISAANPLRIGQNVTVRVRLLNKGYNEATTVKPWRFVPTSSLAGADPATSVFAPQLGIMLGGQQVFADYVGSQQAAGVGGVANFTDLYFTYTVKSGDLALPARFMATTGKAIQGESDATDYAIRYCNYYGSYWRLSNDNGDTAVFHFGAEDLIPDPDPSLVAGAPRRAISGTGLDIFVKTVDFDTNYFSEPAAIGEEGVWRKLYQGLSTALPSLPALKVDGKADAAATMYVWVEDPTVANVLASDSPEIIVQTIGGTTYTRYVIKVPVAKDASSATFKLQGIAVGETHVRMSSSRELTANAAGDVIEDWVERKIIVDTPPNPFVSLEMLNGAGDPQTAFTCSADYKTPIAQMRVTLSQPYTDAVTVGFKVKNAGVTLEGDLCPSELEKRLIGFSFSGDATDLPWEDREFSVKFEAGETVRTLYLYGLGKTTDLANGQKITLTPVVSAPAAAVAFYNGAFVDAAISIEGMKPTITSPTNGEELNEGALGASYTLDVAVSDSFHNLQNSGWTIKIKGTAMGDTAWHSIEDCSVEDGVISEEVDFDQVCTDEILQIKVIDPEGNESAIVKPRITVSEGKTVTARSDKGSAAYAESETETAKVYFDLTQSNGKPLYAFLNPLNDDAKTRVKCAQLAEAGNTGVLIAKGALSSGDNCATVQVIDGGAAALFEVVLCTTSTYDASKKATSYSFGQLQLSVTNVVPRVKSVSMGGTTVKTNGGVMSKTIAMNVNKTFRVDVAEPSSRDLEATGTDAFEVQWKFGAEDWQSVTGNPNTSSVSYMFTTPGEHEVTVRCRDKDMPSGQWSEEFAFTVTVLDQPKITITPRLDTRSYYEDQTGSDYAFDVTLSTPPDMPSGTRLNVELLVEKIDPAGAYKLTDLELSRTNVTFSSGMSSGQSFFLKRLDGTAASAGSGFRVIARATNASADTEGKTWDAGELEIYILNREPDIMQPNERLDAEGNPTATATSKGAENKLTWSIKDVNADTNGMSVVWETSEGARQEYKNPADGNVMSGTHTFKFNESGEKSITMTVTDKDGGSVSRTFYYTIAASKTLTLIPHGPTGGKGTPLSKRYRAASGLGEGRVWAANRSGVRDFMSTYSCGLSKIYTVYAYGYKVGDVSGSVASFPTREDPIDENGNYAPAGGYAYEDPTYDSFLYTWIQIARSEGAQGASGVTMTDSLLNQATSPEYAALKADVGTDVALPVDKLDDETYDDTTLEAVFSKEWLPSDNMGDINKDGVPDIAVDKYGLGVIDTATGLIAGDDLASDTYKYNGDGDYLPNTQDAIYSSFIPGLSNSWVLAGREFTARLELRGYGDAFNDAFVTRFPDGANNLCTIANVKPDQKYVDPEEDETSTLTAIEWWAFTNFCANAELDYADPANWTKWSPERPTDPTVADTDGDELPDGYEYYIWYRAHVGFADADGMYQQIKGRRYVPARPLEPDEISSAEIEALYDPIVPNPVEWSKADTDNDGLPDLIEFMIGTNPFDYDTDNDGLPDGWEVAISKTDPLLYATDGSNCDAVRNDDNDSYAYMSYGQIETYLAFDAEGHTNWLYGADFEPAVKSVETNEVDGVEVVTTNWCLRTENDFFDTWVYGEEDLNKGIRKTPGEAANYWIEDGVIVTNVQKVNARHFQVYEELGFDPRTAWGNNAARLDPMLNTRLFTHMDEFLTMAFYYHCGIGYDRVIGLEDITPSEENPLTVIWGRYTTNPNDADTDKDHMPDGWELYTMFGQFAQSPNVDWGTLPDTLKDMDGDGLSAPEEFQGQQSCWAYPLSDFNTTIVNNDPAWANKKWPTDPWDGDTDEDGISDSGERQACYANISDPTWVDECQAGGGLNPCSWDTDVDGLPDSWELEFAGSFVVSKTETSTTVESNTDTNGVTTASTNMVSTTTGGFWNNDGMDPTVWDSGVPNVGGSITPYAPEDREHHSRDYDHDGLLNWQEYMVGAMRCWRYDDTTDRWMSHKITVDEVSEYFENMDGNSIYRLFLEFNNAHGMYNPGLSNEFFDQFSAFFSRCRKPFDPVYGRYYMFRDGLYHDLQIPVDIFKRNRYGHRTQIPAPYATVSPLGSPIFPGKYITCDPRLADTDFDGMDDFYELYHGLNPLLGASGIPKGESVDVAYDVVFDAYLATAGGAMPWHAENNHWTDGNRTMQDQPFRLKGATGSIYDFYQFPWLNGLEAADPDGDNIRNVQESIMPKLQAASTYQHIDPSPLWMTDSYDDKSLTYRFYHTANPAWAERPADFAYFSPVDYFVYDTAFGPVTNLINDIPGLICVPNPPPEPGYMVYLAGYYPFNFNSADSMFSYEENEGFDSDHDYLGDFEENQGKTKSSSDPQQHDSPIRRQAMWFGGKDDPGFLQNQVESHEYPPEEEAASEARQDFLYYTAEAWVKPDAEILSQQGLFTVLERVLYNGAANAADEKYLRKNFQIAVRNGRWYTKFDSTGTDMNQPVEITDGPVATTNWTHVVATFGPENDNEADPSARMELRLYVNGICYNRLKTGLQPEHNVATIRVDEFGGLNEGGGTVTWTSNYALMLGASVTRPTGILFDYAWRARSYMNITPENPYGLGPQTTLACYGNFFKGYIDEVRIWDGARNAASIKADYASRARYTSELVKENRLSVFSAWRRGAVRSPANKTGVALPPELRYHWAFDHVAGSVEAADVQQTPAGFTTDGSVTDAMATWCRPNGWVEPWWDNIALRSKVYQDTAWVPWVLNTVAHLPRLDNTTLDSVYWSLDYAGYESAISNDYASFSFPLSAEVACRRVEVEYTTSEYTYDNPLTLDTRWDLITATGDEALMDSFRFSKRNRNLEGDDLLMFGSAFPKRISEAEGGMWDDGSAADAWAQTGADADHNGLPDWWEEYARENYCTELDPNEPILWDTTVPYHGVMMPAWQVYLRDLANGLVIIDGEPQYREEFADHHDADGDGMPDWWENLYGIDTGSVADADADPDHDGLSNYQEYLITEVYPTAYGLGDIEGVEVPMLNPTLSHSKVGQPVTDYFLRYSATNATSVLNSAGNPVFELNEYFGEIVTDHDFMEDWWENTCNDAFTSSKRYDPLKDLDEDGWSNFAECRAALWGGYFSAELIDKWTGSTSEQHVNCYPEPIIGVRVTYHGQRDISGMPLVVRTISGQTPRVDATFIVPAEMDSQTRYIGGFAADEKLRGHLSPGLVNANSIVFECARTSSDKYYTWRWAWYDENEEPGHPIQSSGTFEEYKQMYVRYPHIELMGGDLNWEAFTQIVPSSDLSSATVMVDGATKLGMVDCITGEYELDMSKFSLEGGAGQYVYRVTYTSRIGHEWPQTVYVSDTKELSTGSGVGQAGNGRVREGRNTVEVFIDLDGNGAFDPGEPYGSARNVQIGWHKVPVIAIEVKEDSPIMPCVLVGSGSQSASNETGSVAGSLTKKIQIVRQDINGIEAPRTLVTKTVVNDDRAYVTEVDACVASKPDLDWVWLNKDATRRAIDKVEYATYRVEEVATLEDGTITNEVLKTFVKNFSAQRPTAAAVSPIDAEAVYAASPTFAFTVSDESATAYRLQIKYAGAAGTPVYDSGYMLLPGRTGTTVGSSAHMVTPPVYVGAPVYCNALTNHVMFADGSNYEWRVALYNAKYNSDSNDFKDSEEWSKWASFQMDIANENHNPKIATGYGAATLAVRYYGPATVEPGSIVVEAYENADFRGQAMAQVRLMDEESLELLSSTEDISTPNVVFRGLKPGNVYFRAFIDRKNSAGQDDNVRQSWESWGYANYVDSGYKAIYNPKAKAVTASTADWVVGKEADLPIFIEDTDVNQNGYADVEEEKYSDASLTDEEETESVGWWEWAEADPDDETEDDVMAYYETTMWLVTVCDDRNPSDITYGAYLYAGAKAPVSGADASAFDFTRAYQYGDVYGVGLPVDEDLAGCRVYGQPKQVSVIFVHEQVRELFGFCADTAVPNGQVNTRPFTAQDKYLVLRYLEQTGRLGLTPPAGYATFEEYVMNSGDEKVYAKYTLKPGVIDNDYDGLADGWELYVGSDPLNFADRNSDLDGDGLTLVEEFDGGNVPTDPNALDTDGDGVTDYHAYCYHIKSVADALADNDGDGLSNYAEYLISEVFNFAKVDPDNAKTDGACVDYFRKAGDLYLGEIFTDHDRMDDAAEDMLFGERSRYAYNPDEDLDGNGWSNYAEYRAQSDKTTYVQVGVQTNLVVLTFDRDSRALSIFTATNTAAILDTERRHTGEGAYTTGSGDATIMVHWRPGDWISDSALSDGYASINDTWDKVRYTIAQEIPVLAYGGHPNPNITLSVTYAGAQLAAGEKAQLVVKTYTDQAMQKPDAVFVVTNAVGRGVTEVKLATPVAGAVRGGANRIEAYLVAGGDTSEGGEANGAPAYAVGNPYGVAVDVNVGWNAAKAEIELSDVSSVFARVDIANGTTDRALVWGADSGNLEDDTQAAADALSGGQYNHVRIVPYLVSGTLSDTKAPYQPVVMYAQNRVVAEFDVDTNNRGYISEADFIRDGQYDVDWNDFETLMLNNSGIVGAVGDVTAVKYRVVLGANGPIGLEHNLDTSTVVRAFSTLIERRYEPADKRTLPSALVTDGVLYGGCPTFAWRLDEPKSATVNMPSAGLFGCSYTAFQLQIADVNDNVVYDSGVVRAPAHDAEGRFVWTAPVCPREGGAFAPVGNWKWRVAMYNAKFKPSTRESSNGWSAWSTFATAVNQQQDMNDHGYSSLGVAVKYTGPSAVIAGYATAGNVIVQAFETPDFSGAAVAESVVTQALADVSTALPNVTLRGLVAGKTYYVRAFIDSDGDGELADWESWGSAEGAEVSAAAVVKPVVGLYIEDSDTDGDWMPDAYEYAKFGSLTQQGADVLEGGKILFSTEAYNNAKNGLASISSGLGGASLTIFENGTFAKLILGTSTMVTSVADIRAAVEGELKVKKGSLKITAITLDAATGMVKLSVDAEVAPTLAGDLISQIYNVAPGTTKTVTVKVYRKASLATAGWGEPVKTATVTIGAGAAEVPVEGLTITPEEMKSGFYKLEVEE